MKVIHEEQGSIILRKNYIKWDITKGGSSVIITFADAYKNPISCPNIQQAENGNSIWGFDYIKKLNFNVISISSLIEPSWYRDKELFNTLIEIGEDLDLLNIKNRIGYAVSMGAFGATALSGLLKINKNLLFYPISTLNLDLAPFVNGYKWAREHFDWSGEYNDGATCSSEGIIIYDPSNRQDRLHQSRYGDNYERIRALGIGHGGAGKVIKTGLVKEYITKTYMNKKIDINELRGIAKKRRNSLDYYDDLLKIKKISLKRQCVIKKAKLELLKKEFEIHQLLAKKEISAAIIASEKLGGIDSHADLFRDFALENEENTELALKSMLWARKIRPNGPYINKKIEDYLKTLKNHNKEIN